MKRRFKALSTVFILAVVGTALTARVTCAQQAPPSQAFVEKMNYTWWGELVSTDGKTVTVKVPFRDPIAQYIDQFKPGDHTVLTWAISQKGVADAVLYIATYEVMKSSKVDAGYILPVEFVSADKAGKTLTIKATLTDN